MPLMQRWPVHVWINFGQLDVRSEVYYIDATSAICASAKMREHVRKTPVASVPAVQWRVW